ncbi:MAG TPA: hypothetical protein VGN86_11230 [Pyrinomonadaceae bacterium]|jgi:hypothetical protein|nr:hypothetical protein [Pyrinomonadaceae bacterium]
MKLKIRSSYAFAMFAVLLPLGVAGNSEVSAQGWHNSRPTTSARPSTPEKESSGTKNAGTSKSTSAKQGTSKMRRDKSSTAAAANTKGTANPKTQTEETATTATTPKGSRARRVGQKSNTSSSAAPTGNDVETAKTRVGGCDPDKDDRVDLTGTYKGQINYPAAGMAGEATLTVNGNRFTLEAGSKTEAGNVTAIATCNYTAVAMMFGQWKTPLPGEKVLPPLPMLSLTAVKKADRLSLKPSPSERREFSFETSAKK